MKSPIPTSAKLASALAIGVLQTLLAGLTTAYAPLSDDSLRNLPPPGDAFDIHSGALLHPLLIPRVPGTEGQTKAQAHFVDFFATHLPRWSVEWQNSTARTPATGTRDIPFQNLIMRRDPPWASPGDVGRLTLVAHYDSLHSPDGFIGAIDSAAPCAMLLHAARAVEDALEKKWAADGGSGLDEEKGVQILLLDGEEAWEKWSHTDSTYGSRSLAEQWSNEFHPAMSQYKTPLDGISLFMLLDLLGHADPTVPSYFMTTHWAYQGLAEIEHRMRALGLLESSPRAPFLPDRETASHQIRNRGGIEDDHLPFLARGVEILHIIPSPFPYDVWHKMADDGEHLDIATVNDWARITAAFVAEWMELDAFIAPPPKEAQKRDGGKTELYF